MKQEHFWSNVQARLRTGRRGFATRLGLAQNPPRQARILVCAGGGIRGLVSARFLSALMARVGASVQDTFHMVAGNSTGALIGMSQVHPNPLAIDDVAQIYRDHGPKIFSRSRAWGLRTNWGLRGPKYPDIGLRAAVEMVAEDYWLSDSKLDFLAPAFSLSTQRSHWFKSYRAKMPRAYLGGQINPMLSSAAAANEFRLRDVGLASASAPTFFPAANVYAKDGTAHCLVDGGLVSNSPAYMALKEARRIYPCADEIVLVSIGTGELGLDLDPAKAQNYGILGWISPLIGILQAVNDRQQMTHVAEMMAGQPYYDFDRPINPNIPGFAPPSAKLDDASANNIERLDALADYWIDTFAPRLEELAQRLRVPRTNPQHLRSLVDRAVTA